MLLLSSFLISLFITVLLIPPLIRWAISMEIVDSPDERKVHTGLIPRIGGLAMVTGTVAAIFVCCSLTYSILSYILGSLVILVFGFLDDRYDLNYKIKFFGQILAIFFPIFLGDISITKLPFFSEGISGYLSVPLTFFVLLGVTNAINLSDGLDGLAGGTSLLSLCLIGILSYLSGTIELALIVAAIVGGTLGFLRFNTYPAETFMGDSGSQFLGFSIGILSIWVTQIVNQALSPVLPLLILGLPILDTVMVMGKRVKEGRSPFSPDKNHIHHRFLAMGLHHYEAVFVIYLMQSVLIIASYFMRYQSDLLIMLVFLSFCFSVFLFFNSFDNKFHIFKKNKTSNSKFMFSCSKGIKKILLSFQEKYLNEKYIHSLLFVVMLLYLLLGVVFSKKISSDVYLLINILFVFSVVLYVFSIRSLSISFEKAAAYTAIAVCVYAFDVSGVKLQQVNWLMNLLFVVLIIGAICCVACKNENKFKPTPLDYLLIFFAALSPQLSFIQNEVNVGETIFKIIILFYIFELLTGFYDEEENKIQLLTVFFLGVLVLNGFLLS